jgi:predicted NBD/HSP70 family sugar kinase
MSRFDCFIPKPFSFRSEMPAADIRELLRSPAQRDQNKQRVLRNVMIEPATQARLAQLTGLSQATVSTVVKELERDDFVTVDESGGARTVKLRPPTHAAAIGIELGLRHLTVIARRLDERGVETATTGLGADRGENVWLTEVIGMIDSVVTRTGMTKENITSVGLAVPAAIEPANGRLAPPILVPWSPDYRPGKVLSDKLGLPVITDNDANMGAFGEFLYGAGQGRESLVYLKTGSPIGAGLVIDGRLFRGRHGLAGEIGHLTINPNGPVCRCGNRGCLETVAGNPALLDEIREAFSGYYMPDLPTSLETLVDRVRSGTDPAFNRVVEDAGRNLGLALASLCNLFDPHAVVLGGQLARSGDTLLTGVQQTLNQYALSGVVSTDFEMFLSALGPEAEARGAMALGILYA